MHELRVRISPETRLCEEVRNATDKLYLQKAVCWLRKLEGERLHYQQLFKAELRGWEGKCYRNALSQTTFCNRNNSSKLVVESCSFPIDWHLLYIYGQIPSTSNNLRVNGIWAVIEKEVARSYPETMQKNDYKEQENTKGRWRGYLGKNVYLETLMVSENLRKQPIL